MKVYYLNRERFSKGDTKIAFEFAKKLILKNPNLKSKSPLARMAVPI